MTRSKKNEVRVKRYNRLIKENGEVARTLLCFNITHPDGKRKIEGSGLSIYPAKKGSAQDKKNKKTLEDFEEMLVERKFELNQDSHLSQIEIEARAKARRANVEVFKFIEEHIAKQANNASRSTNALNEAALGHFKAIAPNTTTFGAFKKIDAIKVKDGVNSLHLDVISRVQYLKRIAYFFKLAKQADIIENSPFEGVSIKVPKEVRVKKRQNLVFLTSEELDLVLASPPEEERLKPSYLAFCVACLTGLRGVDIKKLLYSNFKEQGGVVYLDIIQQKTQEPLRVPVSDRLFNGILDRALIGKGVLCIPNLPVLFTYNKHLREYANYIGLDKDITLHAGRHTFATVLLEKGVDIYNVSKLMGHSSVTMTEKYSRALPSKLAESVSAI